MSFKFHHMNFCTDNLPRLTNFYKTLFELGTINNATHTVISGQRDDRAYTGKVDFLTDGGIEFHLAERDLDTVFSVQLPGQVSTLEVSVAAWTGDNRAARSGDHLHIGFDHIHAVNQGGFGIEHAHLLEVTDAGQVKAWLASKNALECQVKGAGDALG